MTVETKVGDTVRVTNGWEPKSTAMHVYLVTGVVLTISMALLVSLVKGVDVEIVAAVLKWASGILLVVGLFFRGRRAKWEEERQARLAEQMERYRGKH